MSNRPTVQATTEVCGTCGRPVWEPGGICSAVHQPWFYHDGRYVGFEIVRPPTAPEGGMNRAARRRAARMGRPANG